MPRLTELPRFRTRERKFRDGSVVCYYFWDGRGHGLKEISLGRDKGAALKRYEECEKGQIPKKGKKLASRRPGKRRKITGLLDDLDQQYRRMYLNAERRAEENRRAFTITPQQFMDLICRANGACELTGLPFERGEARHAFAPSLDRIDCARGYEFDNVRLVCFMVNAALGAWGLEPLLRMSEALLRKRCGSG